MPYFFYFNIISWWTFNYNEKGHPVGLLSGKNVLTITSSGSNWDEQGDYIKTMRETNPLFGNYGRDLITGTIAFIGLHDNWYVNVDRTNIGSEEELKDSIEKAKNQLAHRATKF